MHANQYNEDTDGSGDEVITIEDVEDASDSSSSPSSRGKQGPSSEVFKNSHIRLPDLEEEEQILTDGAVIKIGSTWELRDPSERPEDQLHSGDFLRVQHIIRNVQTDEVRLRGFRLRRTKYHGQIFDCGRVTEISQSAD